MFVQKREWTGLKRHFVESKFSNERFGFFDEKSKKWRGQVLFVLRKELKILHVDRDT